MSRTEATAEGLYRKRRKRRDGSVYESPTWWCRVRLAGRDLARSTGETDRRRAAVAARRIRAELEAEIEAQRAAGAVAGGGRRGLTVAQMGEWDKATRARKGVSLGQQEAVRYAWDRLDEKLGHIDPRRIAFATVAAYVDARLEEVSGQTVRKELQALKRGMAEARDRKHAVPELRRWPEVPTTPKNVRQAGKAHEPAVLRAWLAELREPSDRIAALRADPRAAMQAETILRTGLRVEEVRRLCITWVEPAPEASGVPAYLRVPAEAAKTGTERTIALTREAVEVLLAAAEITPDGTPLMPGDYRKAWASARARIGYEPRITPRDLRHCYATLGTLGGDVVAVQEAMGHSDLRTTSRYVHGTAARTVTASTTVADLLSRGDPTAGTPPPGEVRPFDESAVGTEEWWDRGGWIRTSDRLLPKQVWRTIWQLAASQEGAEGVRNALLRAGLCTPHGDPARGPLSEPDDDGEEVA